jgi:hypothetical protein
LAIDQTFERLGHVAEAITVDVKTLRRCQSNVQTSECHTATETDERRFETIADVLNPQRPMPVDVLGA